MLLMCTLSCVKPLRRQQATHTHKHMAAKVAINLFMPTANLHQHQHKCQQLRNNIYIQENIFNFKAPKPNLRCNDPMQSNNNNHNKEDPKVPPNISKHSSHRNHSSIPHDSCWGKNPDSLLLLLGYHQRWVMIQWLASYFHGFVLRKYVLYNSLPTVRMKSIIHSIISWSNENELLSILQRSCTNINYL